MTDAQHPNAPEQLAANIAGVHARIASACERAGRAPRDVTLIAISKTHSVEDVAAAYLAGVRNFGENRVQEAAPKIDALASQGLKPAWHLVGNLQRNKVAPAVPRFDVIHSVDSLRLAQAIDERARTAVRVFIEVNVAEDPTKHGVPSSEAAVLARSVAALPHIDIVGLMTVAPLVSNAEEVRPVFQRLRELRDALGLRELSMGMTNDFEVAIEEGATFVRVGRAIFGERSG